MSTFNILIFLTFFKHKERVCSEYSSILPLLIVISLHDDLLVGCSESDESMFLWKRTILTKWFRWRAYLYFLFHGWKHIIGSPKRQNWPDWIANWSIDRNGKPLESIKLEKIGILGFFHFNLLTYQRFISYGFSHGIKVINTVISGSGNNKIQENDIKIYIY